MAREITISGSTELDYTHAVFSFYREAEDTAFIRWYSGNRYHGRKIVRSMDSVPKEEARAIFATVRMAMTEWLEDGCRENLVDKARRVLEFMEQGLEGLAPFLLHDRNGGTR